jgi:gluconolactonase
MAFRSHGVVSSLASGLAVLFLASAPAVSQTTVSGGPEARPSSRPAETVTPDIAGVVKGGTRVRLIAWPLQNTEGPIAAADGALLFTEGNRITRIGLDDAVSSYIEPSYMPHGLAYDKQGRLVAVMRGGTGVRSHLGTLQPTHTILVDGFEGQPFPFLNDIVISAKTGIIYFTDSGEAADAKLGLDGPRIRDGFFSLTPDGRLAKWPEALVDDISFPSGLILSPDERLMYINDLNGDWLYVLDVGADGSLTNRRKFGQLTATAGVSIRADGLAVDAAGRVYCATTAGIQVFSREGKNLGTIPIFPRAQNIAFAGPDKKTLYAVGFGAAWKIDMIAQGFRGRAK